ncbi:hypothetical protein FOL47_003668 [Perkinsus chesapeaki]|uniref:Uncharacterized protein n=1 Tax=Perkinsus chesapeaki TaxID=330153 RepID=A0A7J6M785_PERCH|nr:hypothetical protein FOL47_003668 [Perkinsus chesapeaki]
MTKEIEDSYRSLEQYLFPRPCPELPNHAEFRKVYLMPNRPGCFKVSKETMGLADDFAEDPVGWMLANFGDKKGKNAAHGSTGVEYGREGYSYTGLRLTVMCPEHDISIDDSEDEKCLGFDDSVNTLRFSVNHLTVGFISS